jgi:hypothetical protein
MNTDHSAIQWLLKSDPAIRWQALRDLTGAQTDEFAIARADVATEGWGVSLLSAQAENGMWSPGNSFPELITLRALLMLRDIGLDPASEQARRALTRVRENVTWLMLIPEADISPDINWYSNELFAGEVEPCINGRVVTIGAYFGINVQPVVERLLGEQMEDGGWNCDQDTGSRRGSFHTTICVLEGLLEFERATGGSPAVKAARERGQEYLLERRLLRRLSDGKIIDPDFSQFSYEAGWRYDILRGLDYFRAAATSPDSRMAEAIEIIKSKRDTKGRWALGAVHPNEVIAEPGVTEGKPSRWNTLRAMRVLAWYSGKD